MARIIHFGIKKIVKFLSLKKTILHAFFLTLAKPRIRGAPGFIIKGIVGVFCYYSVLSSPLKCLIPHIRPTSSNLDYPLILDSLNNICYRELLQSSHKGVLVFVAWGRLSWNDCLYPCRFLSPL